MELAIAIATLVISFVTALFVFQNNPKSATHVYFGMLVFCISLYPIFNYLAVNSAEGQAFLWAKLILLVSIPQGPLLYFFAKVYPEPKFVFKPRLQLLIALWVLLNIILAFAGLLFKGVIVEDKTVTIEPGPVIPSFGILHATTILAGLTVLAKKYHRSKGQNRKQLGYVFYGILLSFSLMFLITIILPIFLKNTVLLAISPIFLALSVVVVAYAIVSQKLFDIRAAVARSVAYVLSLSFIGFVYGLIIFALFSMAGLESLSVGMERAIYVGLALATAVMYPGIKKFFATATTKIFFQDTYDPQQFLDALNRVLVAKVDLEPLLKDTAQIIQESISAEYCSFAIRPTAYFEERVIGTRLLRINEEDLKLLHELTPKLHHRVIVADELQEEDAELKKIMNRYDIAVMARLVTTIRYDIEGIGYLMLGAKKSGNIYSSQDKNIVGIIANELVIAIQNALRFEEIEKFNETLQEKVDDATKQLRKTNDKLKQLDETKDEFISMASHQLRTPLTSVKGYLSMVLEGDAGEISEMQRKLLDQAFVSSQRMVYLIADLLNVSRLRTGKFVIEPIISNLADVVEGEIGQLKDTASGRGLELTYDKPSEFPALYLDETKMRQVIMNFTDNAIYYTPSGGHITVRLEDKGESIEFTVSDDGMGVPKSEQPHLFTKFYRANNAKTARPDGTGLGLFMAKKVIVAQGGSIIFNSQEGKGSTFGFMFPKSKLQPPASEQPASHE